jgi:large subunit ribosomal protein L4
MRTIPMTSLTGGKAGEVDLPDSLFGIEPNVAVMHQVVTAQLAARRAGTHSTKTRAEVRGGGAKPYRQKGTGNARQGSTNSPQFVGGGVALGPKPRSYRQRTPKKMIKLALRSALSDRAADGKVIVVDDWGIGTARTRDAVAALSALGIDGRVLVVVESHDSPVAWSFRNLPEVQVIKAGEMNAYDVLCNEWIVFSESNLPHGAAEPLTSDSTRVITDEPAEGARDATDDEPLVIERSEDPAEGAREEDENA